MKPQSTQGEFKTADELDDEQRGLLGVSARDNTLFRFQDDSSCIARVRPWRPGLLPRLDVESVCEWARTRAKRVQSVVVFGSHARGTDNKHSDVDVMVIGRLSDRDKTSLREALSPSSVDIVDRTSMSKFRAGVDERHLSVENQVMRHGVQIFGRLPQSEVKLKERQFPIDGEAFVSHVRGASTIVSTRLAYLREYIALADQHGLHEVDLREHVADSSDAAERTAKAFLTCVGLSPEHKHDIPALVAQLRREAHQRRATRTPQGLPDTEALVMRIEAMNHNTADQALHTLVYHEGGVFMHHPEARELVINAEERCASVIDNLVWLLRLVKDDGDLGEIARKSQIQIERCFRVAMRRESEHAPTDVIRFEQALGISASLPETLYRTNTEFEALSSQ